MSKQKPELWHAIYRTPIAGGELIALFKEAQHASEWRQNPEAYIHVCRRVLLKPAPITVFETDVPKAIELLDAILNGPDNAMPIDEAKKFLAEIYQRT